MYLNDRLYRKIQWTEKIRRLEIYEIITIFSTYFGCIVLDENKEYNGMIYISKKEVDGDKFMNELQAKSKFPQYFI